MTAALLRCLAAWIGILGAAGAAGAEAAASRAITTSPPVAASRAPRAMALTFDDLPYAAREGLGELSEARRATAALLRCLRAHHAPAVGFVNEAKIRSDGEVEARTGLLRQWVDAGAVLGNHTYSHADLNTLTVPQFEEEIARGDEVTRRLMRGRRPYRLYFRHPWTHTGETGDKKAAIERFLTARGYTIAPHTIDSEDYVYNTAYCDALTHCDRAAADRLRVAYVEFVISAAEFAERVAPRIFGRNIPQTILLHANRLNADALEVLLARLESRGYRFVTLDEAMADPAYRTKDTLVTASGPTWLWRWMKSRGMTVSFRDDPEPPSLVLDLAKRGTK